MKLLRRLFVFVLVLVAANGILAQEIPLDELAQRLRPLTVEELTSEAGAVQGRLKQRLESLNDARLGAAPNETRVASMADAAQEELDRLRIVTAELKRKGADVATLRSYIAAVTAGDEHLDSAGHFGTVVWEWLRSPDHGLKYGAGLLKALGVFVLFYILARFVSGAIGRLMRRSEQVSELVTVFMVRLARRIVLMIGLVIAASTLGISTAPLLAIIGAAGFAVGFALKDTLGNFASGLMILIYKPFDVGHFVDIAGISGTVDSLNLFSTHLKTPDNKIQIVPNGSVWGDVITNATSTSRRRVDLTFGIGYGDDIGKAQGILERIVTEHPKVLEDPAPVIRLHELADSSVNFVCRPWVKVEDYWEVYWDITRSVKEKFDAEGVSIPFPQRDVHLIQEAPAS